ncbi:MAG: hypothetical protein Q8P41_17180 [Pseudomonadota bacterium]|nr:hypothetical protein [Pseudomonadota bacterium]
MVELLLLAGCFLATPEPEPPSLEALAYERRMEIVRLDGVELLARREELERMLLTEADPRMREDLAGTIRFARDPRSIPVFVAALAVEQDAAVQRRLAACLLGFREQAAIDGVVDRYLRGVDPSVDADFLSGFGGAEPCDVRISVARLSHLNPERAERILRKVEATSGPAPTP